LLPEADLASVTPNSNVHPGRTLATLPVQIVVPGPSAAATQFGSAVAHAQPVEESTALSPIQLSLIIAWTCLLSAAGAVAVLLLGVVTLSERRGAFVSAVTHELRTPLTTFRMYAEMLTEGMVPDAERRQSYLETLRVEADRLAHLVENVLAYARLERGRPGRARQSVTVEALMGQVQSRLADRATQAQMKLVIRVDEATRAIALRTDPAAVEQVLFNLVDNACKYAGTADDRQIHVDVEPAAKGVRFAVRDHGPGISSREAKSLFRPFSKSVQQAANSAPGVGLGLALCRRLAASLGGRLELQTPREGGAAFVLTLPADS
jgi:signal transduction histidine kinase